MPAKVLRVDPDGKTLHVRLANGSVARLTGLTGIDVLCRGNVILFSNDGWEIAPTEVWPQDNSIAVVRSVLDDGTVLVDYGVGVKAVRNDCDVPVSINNTIEFSDDDGVSRVVSESPIHSGALGAVLDDEAIRKEYLVDASGDGPTFADFGGYPHVVARAQELIRTQLAQRDALEAIGARPVKGILFTGPPGTGKTYLARIIAHETEADFYLISGPSIISKWLGDTEDTLRRIFDAAIASKSGRAIVFIDEIDSIAERRTSETHEASRRLVAQLLTLMDGFDDAARNVIVIAATNRVEVLDPALTRPGRFDWEVEFGMPTSSDRLEILKVGASHLATSSSLPLDEIASLSEGWSAADLTAIWTEAALVTAGDDRKAIAAEDVAQAFERVMSKPRRAVRQEGE